MRITTLEGATGGGATVTVMVLLSAVPAVFSIAPVGSFALSSLGQIAVATVP